MGSSSSMVVPSPVRNISRTRCREFSMRGPRENPPYNAPIATRNLSMLGTAIPMWFRTNRLFNPASCSRPVPRASQAIDSRAQPYFPHQRRYTPQQATLSSAPLPTRVRSLLIGGSRYRFPWNDPEPLDRGLAQHVEVHH